jgi:hypothetical protein
VTDDRVLVEGVRIGAVKVSSRWHQGVADKSSWHRARANFDTRAVDTFLLHKVLSSVERALCACFRMLVRRGVSDHHELRASLLLHGQSYVVKAALRLVVYARRAAAVSLEADVAEVLRLRNGWGRRNGQGNLSVCLRTLTKIIDDVASDGDRRCGKAGGG